MSIKKFLLLMVLSVFVGFSGISWAHDTIGEGITANAVPAGPIMNIDVHHASCFSWAVPPVGDIAGPADRFVAQIRRDTGVGNVRVTLGRITGPAGSFNPVPPGPSPAANGGIGAFGACASITSAVGQGNGLYQFAVSHDNATANNYTVRFHCERTTSSTGAAVAPCSPAARHTGTGVQTSGMEGVGSKANQVTTIVPTGDYRKIIDR